MTCDACGARTGLTHVFPGDRFPTVVGSEPFGRVRACGPCVVARSEPLCDAHGVENHACGSALV